MLYDVTTLYFEIQKDDEYRTLRLSKERRFEPQITLGLLVNREGFPLEVQSFEGNCAEVKTILPVLSSFKERHGLNEITVTADSAMLSAGNIEVLERLGYHYIIGSRLTKTLYEIEVHLSETDGFTDKQIVESQKTVTIDGKRKQRREIFQYREKRARLDLSNIEKTALKAQNMVDGKTNMKKNRFLKISSSKKEINQKLIESAKRRAGIKGYVTDLDIPPQQVIDAYHQLFQVEKSFRMTKSDLKARSIFHHKKDSIEAHLTIVFTALAIVRHIESATSISTKKFINTLKPIRTGIVAIGEESIQLEPEIPTAIIDILKTLDLPDY